MKYKNLLFQPTLFFKIIIIDDYTYLWIIDQQQKASVGILGK